MKLHVKFKETNQRIGVKFREVFNVSDGGYEKGYTEGYDEGHEIGYNAGSEKGQEIGYKQGEAVGYEKGNADGYETGYKDGGNGILSYATNMNRMFYQSVFPDGSELDIYIPNFAGEAEWLVKECTGLHALKLRCDNTEGIVYLTQSFMASSVEILDLTNFKRTFGASAVNFAQGAALVTIMGDLDLTNMTGSLNFLSGASKLVNVTFVPNTIGCSLSIGGSRNLSAESAKSAILGLKNFSGTDKAYAYTFTLHANVWALLDAEGATAPNGVTWYEYVTEVVCWNA